MRALVLAAVAGLLLGCGQYGPLYLSESQEKAALQAKKQQQKKGAQHAIKQQAPH